MNIEHSKVKQNIYNMQEMNLSRNQTTRLKENCTSGIFQNEKLFSITKSNTKPK